ncbi:MAG: hypothetical protein KDD22_02075 [Bdellovibrionales bacterium]|nr:hypothetical protein [Bdellovibrionales bacterium]
MKFKIFLIGLFVAVSSSKTYSVEPVKKTKVVQSDYGILSVADKTRKPLTPVEWRCFPIKDVQVKYHTWRDADPMGRYDVIVTMCNFEIRVSSKPFPHVYSGRRAKEVVYCNDFRAAWNKLTQGEEHICFDGETITKGEPEKDAVSKKMRVSWTWDKVKTKKGCYSFWDGYQCANF